MLSGYEVEGAELPALIGISDISSIRDAATFLEKAGEAFAALQAGRENGRLHE